jgi:hypothetical protein
MLQLSPGEDTVMHLLPSLRPSQLLPVTAAAALYDGVRALGERLLSMDLMGGDSNT